MMKWPFFAISRTTVRKKRTLLAQSGKNADSLRRRFRPLVEQLEDRVLFATNITTFHTDYQATGANLTETDLTPLNLNTVAFGKLYSTPVDGQLVAQPLVLTNVTITGANAGTYASVAFVATENDSLYAVNSATGAILWQRGFLDTTNSNDFLPGASSVTTLGQADMGSTDILPSIGITGTPVIDPSTNTLYVDVKTKETGRHHRSLCPAAPCH